MCHISPRYIKEAEDRIKDSLVEEIIGKVIDLLVEIAMKVIEDLEEVEVIFREAVFGEVIFKVDIKIEWIVFGKIGGHGDNLGQEKEKDGVGHHLVLDWDQELVQIEIGLGVSYVESMTTLQMSVLIRFLIIQTGKVIGQDQYHCIWQIVIQVQRQNII